MRFLIIALALTVLTGSQASSPKSESDLRLEKWLQDWESRMRVVIDHVGDEVNLLHKSEFYQELENLLTVWVSNVTDFWSKHDWPEDMRQTSNLLFGIPSDIFSRVVDKVFAIGTNIHLLQSIDAAFDMLAEYVDPVLEPITPQVETLFEDVAAKAEGQIQTLTNTRKNFQSLGDQLVPYVKELTEYGKSAQPTVIQAEEKFILVLEAFHKHVLGPYLSPIVKASEKYISDLERWASGRVGPPKQSEKQ